MANRLCSSFALAWLGRSDERIALIVLGRVIDIVWFIVHVRFFIVRYALRCQRTRFWRGTRGARLKGDRVRGCIVGAGPCRLGRGWELFESVLAAVCEFEFN